MTIKLPKDLFNDNVKASGHSYMLLSNSSLQVIFQNIFSFSFNQIHVQTKEIPKGPVLFS